MECRYIHKSRNYCIFSYIDDVGFIVYFESFQFLPILLKVPRDPTEPCELCYCIRNHTACVRQECDLRVPGCEPIYQDGVCCPVKYRCGKP